jgi:TetR/AcrR family transcriptional repressor of nem operon
MAGRPREFDEEDALRSAIELFWSRGYEACSISMLMEQMGLNRQSAYNVFGDKRALFLQALAKYAANVERDVGTLLGRGDVSPWTCVRDFMEAIVKRTTAGKHIGCMMTNTIVELGPHDPEVRKLIAGVLGRLENRLAELLKAAMEQKEIPGGRDPRKLARFIISIMQGALVLCKARMDDAIVDAVEMAQRAVKGS